MTEVRWTFLVGTYAMIPVVIVLYFALYLPPSDGPSGARQRYEAIRGWSISQAARLGNSPPGKKPTATPSTK